MISTEDWLQWQQVGEEIKSGRRECIFVLSDAISRLHPEWSHDEVWLAARMGSNVVSRWDN